MSNVQRTDVDIEWEAIPRNLRQEIIDDYTETRRDGQSRDNWETLLYKALNGDPVKQGA